MKYIIEFELPDNETVLKEIKTDRVNWSIWGYNGQAKAKPILKEQEPKLVIAEKRKILIDDSCDVARYMVDVFYHCPSCDLIFSRTHMNKDIHFCNNCGQAVRWE